MALCSRFSIVSSFYLRVLFKPVIVVEQSGAYTHRTLEIWGMV